MKSANSRVAFLLIACAVLCLLLARPVWASEGGGADRWGIWLLIGRLFNLALVVFVLVWIARRPLTEFYASRSRFIREQLDEAQNARADAEARLAEVEAHMARLNDELAGIKAAAERAAEEEYQRLVGEAELDAARIIERARQEIDGMSRSAHMQLRAHAAELIVQLAEQQIRREITDADRSRLAARFVNQLGGKG